MRVELYPGLRLSRSKVEGVVRHFVITPGAFQLAAFEDGQVVGAVAAMATEMLWFERCEAHVVLCRATRPHVIRTLLRELRRWADGEFLVRRVVWPTEFHHDERMTRLAARHGFDNQLTLCSYYKE
jgi:hypothetical protein